MSIRPDPKHRISSPPDVHRVLPHSLEAEQGLLGSMLIAPADVMDDCAQRITAEAFYQPSHQTIFALLVELWDKQQPADIITLTQALRERKQLEVVGGPAYITSLIDYTPTAANAGYYLDMILGCHLQREVIGRLTALVSRAYEDQPGRDVSTLLDDAEAAVLGIRDNAITSQIDALPMKDGVMAAVEAIEKLYDRRGSISGLPTGFADLDRLTSGMQPAEMIVIAARPSMGKTAFAMNIAEHVASAAKVPVGVFSLEMSRNQLIQRMLCSRAKVNLQKVRDGFLSDRDFPNLTNAASNLADAPIYIDDASGITINALRARARRMHRRQGVGLIVIDYLQLLRSDSKRAGDNRQIEIGEISNGIKTLAKELKVPIIVLAQLNRNPEARKGGRPMLSDLRESGNIEQDADLVGLLMRKEYYAENEEAKEEAHGEAELIIAKQRNGPVGEVKLTFLKEFTRFEDRAPERTATNVRDIQR